MTKSVTTNASERRCIATFQGKITYDIFFAHFEALLAEKTFSHDQLILAPEAVVDFSRGDVQRLINFMEAAKAIETPGRIAIVVTDQLSFGLMRMFSMRVDLHSEVRVFHAQREAVQWLGW